LTLFELDEAANRIREEVDSEANIIVGSTMDPSMEGMMRVSVVATGIDAAPANRELPVPRRSLAEPLRQHSVLEARDVRVEPARPAAAALVQPPEPVAVRAEEPSLFTSLEAERAAAEDQMEDIFEPREERYQPAAQVGDNLPPPAYAPRGDDEEEDLDAFVAPRAPAAGMPSPEALARLHSAVGNAASRRPEGAQTPQARAAAQQTHQAQPQQASERPRFGINSLLNRMTGHAAEGVASAPRQQPSVQAQQPARIEPEDDRDEQIEIPAFLRRQAN
jgi:cell division protein FtsZ